MSRIQFIVRAVIGLAALLSAAVGWTEPRWAELNADARQAIDAGDYQRLRTTLTELAPLMPGNVRIAYNTAAAAARLGDTTAALDGLRDICDMGLVFDFDADSDFASLRQMPEYDAVRECMTRNSAPVTHARLWRTLTDTDLLPEDIAYDPKTVTVFISSVRKNRIINASGELFASTEMPVFALAVDVSRRTLWATVGWVPQCESCPASDAGKTALIAFNIDSRQLLRRIDSPVPGLFGDMTISSRGDIYVSEGQHGALFHLAPGATELERLDAPGELRSPQQPALSADEMTLYVPDYVRGIAAIDLRTRTLAWRAPAAGIALSGIDGLDVYGDSFIAVQNGTRPARVVRLSQDLTQQQVLEANWPGLGEPTHATLVGDRYLFIANSGWQEYEESGKKRPGSAPVTSAIYEIAPEHSPPRAPMD